MAGYTKNREQNYETKYLRKVLGQVDDRIRVPESVSADSLRRLLDNVEPHSVHEVTSRRPRWLSLQSGIAYAAAFVLIVALFYSTRLYRPDMISGGTNIAEPEQQPLAPLMPANAYSEDVDADVPDAAAGAAQTPEALPEPATEPAPDGGILLAEAAEAAGEGPARSSGLGTGGGGKANLLLEQDEYAFYWRANDLNDPDRASLISFEVVNTGTQEILTQTDVPLSDIAQGFELDGSLVFIGTSLEGSAAICSYDISDPGEPVEQVMFTQDGGLVDARVYKDIVRIVSLSEDVDPDIDSELLPGGVSSETCVITAFDPVTQDTVTKQFAGANGTIQIHNLNAYIRYTGEDEYGESRDYIAQIIFDGMDITLGTVS